MRQTTHIATLVERHTRFVVLLKIPSKDGGLELLPCLFFELAIVSSDEPARGHRAAEFAPAESISFREH
jgi:hypothetical protein